MEKPPKRTSESTRHLRAVDDTFRSLTPDSDPLLVHVKAWGRASDCMAALVDESEKQRKASEDLIARAEEALSDTRRAVLLAATVALLGHFIISWAYARTVAPDPLQAKRDTLVQP